MSPFLCRCTVHPRNVLCSPSYLILHALATACANSLFSLAVVATKVLSSMLTAESIVKVWTACIRHHKTFATTVACEHL